MKIIIAYAFLFFGLGINYIFNIMVARWLGPEDFGHYSYALSVFSIFSLIAVMSLDEAAVRFIPQSTEKQIMGAAIQRLAIVFSIVLAIIYYAMGHIFLPSSSAPLNDIFVLCLPLLVMIVVGSAILQSHHLVGPRMALRYAVEPMTKMIFLVIFFKLAEQQLLSLTLVSIPAYAFFLALLLTNMVACVCYRKYLLCVLPIAKNQFMHILHFVLPLIFYNVLNVISGRLDVLILGVMANAYMLGQYSAAFQTAAMLAIVLQGIETVYAPIFSESIGKSDFKQLHHDYQQSLRWTLLIASPVVLVFAIYPQLALMPFGAAYRQAIPIFLILCVGQFFNLATGSANAILLAMGKTREVLINTLVYVVCAAFFISMGAYADGINGAAIGVVAAIAIPNLLRVWWVYKICAVHPFNAHYFKTLLAMLITLLVALSSKSMLGYAGLLLYPLLFLACVFLLGMHQQDKNFISKVVLCRR
jgi:hypothetical protein